MESTKKKKNQVRAHLANRISSFRGGGDVEETNATAVVDRVGESQGCKRGQIGDLVQGCNPGNLGLVGALKSQDDILGGHSDQEGSRIGENCNTGNRKNKVRGLGVIKGKTLTQIEGDSDLDSLHIPETSEDLSLTISGSTIIWVQPAIETLKGFQGQKWSSNIK